MVNLGVVAELERVAITTFAVEPARLAARLAPGVEPREVAIGGRAAALVSAVSFVARDLRHGRLPWPRVTCGHVDYRAYVFHQGEPAVWFLGAEMDSRLAGVPRRLWGMPWRRAPVSIQSHDGAGYAVRGSGALHAVPSDAPVDGIEGFTSVAHAADVLVNPCVGLYHWRGRIGRYEVGHPRLEPRAAHAAEARFPAFDGLSPRLHSVLLLPEFTITIRLPPRRLSSPASPAAPPA